MQIGFLKTEITGINPEQTFSPAQMLGQLSNGITDYSRRRSNPASSSSPETIELAISIFDSVVRLRSMGIIQNNPENLKVLDFFKARTSELGEENKRLQSDLKAAYQVIQDLEARLGQRAKGSRQVS